MSLSLIIENGKAIPHLMSLNESKVDAIINGSYDWENTPSTINGVEWENGDITITFDYGEAECSVISEPYQCVSGTAKIYRRLTADSFNISQFPFDVPSIVSRSNFSIAVPDDCLRVALYFTGNANIKYREPISGYLKRGLYTNNNVGFECHYTNDGENIQTLPTGTTTALSSIGYSDSYYDKTISGVEYHGNFFRGGGYTANIDTISKIFKEFLQLSSYPPFKNEMKISCNCLVFENLNDADYYLKTGDSSRAIKEKQTEKVETLKYIECDIYKNSQPVKSGSTLKTFNGLKLFYNSAIESYSGSRPIVGYVMENNTNWYNIKLIENDGVEWTQNGKEATGDHIYNDVELFENVINPHWTYSEMFKYSYPDSSDYEWIYGKYDTNIPIFATEELARKYLRGEIDESQSISGGGLKPDVENGTGDPMTSTDFNRSNGETVGSETLCLSWSQADLFFRTLFTTDEAILPQIVDGLKLYGSDPASFLVDYFAIPFNASTFAELSSSTNVSFGSYTHNFGVAMPRLRHVAPVMRDMFSIYIDGAFKDWRDYSARYYLFLPYLGITEIDIDKLIYKTLSCRVSVDVRTGQIKYFLLSNGILIDTFETICRVSLPLTSTNTYQNAREKLDAITNVGGGLFNLGSSAGGITSGGGKSPMGWVQGGQGITNAFKDMSNGMLDLAKIPTMNVSGSCSPSNAWLDPSYSYMIIHSPEFIYPPDIINYYSLPDNRVGVIGNNSGFVQADDIILTGCVDCSEDEKNKIKSLILEGIYV